MILPQMGLGGRFSGFAGSGEPFGHARAPDLTRAYPRALDDVTMTPKPMPRIEPKAPRVRRLAPGPSDSELVLRARAGESWAQAAIFRRHAEDVTNVVTRLLGRLGDADDIVQDTFVDAFSSLSSLREPAALRSWLLGIAVRRVRRRIRRTQLLRRLGLDRGADDATLAASVDPNASPEVQAELALVDRVLGTVSADARVAWMLRRVEGEELTTVASAIGVSLATVKRRIAEVDTVLERHGWGAS